MGTPTPTQTVGFGLSLRNGRVATDLFAQARFESVDPVPEVGNLFREFSEGRFGGARIFPLVGVDPHCELPKIAAGEPERARYRLQGCSVAALGDAVLQLPESRNRDARALCQFALRDFPLPHSVVDDVRNCGPVRHACPPHRALTGNPRADYRIYSALDSARKKATLTATTSSPRTALRRFP